MPVPPPPSDLHLVGGKIATDIPLLPILSFPLSPLYLFSFPFLSSLLFFYWGGGEGGGKSFPRSPSSLFFFSSSSSFFSLSLLFPFFSFSLSPFFFFFFFFFAGGGGAKARSAPPLDPRLVLIQTKCICNFPVIPIQVIFPK